MRRWMQLLGSTAMLSLMLAMAGAGSAGAAQDEELVDQHIAAGLCDALPWGGPGTIDDAGCEPAVGVQFEVATEDGELLGTCTTEAPATGISLAECGVQVPASSPIVVTEVAPTIPDGYAPLENTVSLESRSSGPPQGPEPPVYFFNLPTDGDSPVPVFVQQLIAVLIQILRSISNG